MTAPFEPKFYELPDELAIFPLTGALLLPHGRLPLNIFEPRYLNMILDALGTPTRLIGMIQPLSPESEEAKSALYTVGCAGRISSFSETEDGRLLITLSGVCRFRIQEELAERKGYRRVRPDWQSFAKDFETQGEVTLDRERLLTALKDYFKAEGIGANWEAIEHTPNDRLVTSLAMICPFEPSEKQALLEAPNLDKCAELMTALIEMALLNQDGGEPARH
jgi:Lon protease-like protein